MMNRRLRAWRRYPGKISPAGALWAACLLGGLAWLDHAVRADVLFLVPPFAATLSILYYLPQQPVAQPAPVVFGSTLGATIGTLFHLVGLHGPASAALAAIVLFWLLPRIGLYHPPGIALSMFPLLLHPGLWFPVAVVFPFTLIAVSSHWILSRRWPGWPKYPREE